MYPVCGFKTIQIWIPCIHAIDVIDLTSEMLAYYGDAAGVPKYIKTTENNQKKAQWAQLVIPDVTLVSVARHWYSKNKPLPPRIRNWRRSALWIKGGRCGNLHYLKLTRVFKGRSRPVEAPTNLAAKKRLCGNQSIQVTHWHHPQHYLQNRLLHG